MGIRFRCHHCGFDLNVKDFQAGKRGRCPSCKGKFRIPLTDADQSLELDELLAGDHSFDTDAGAFENIIEPDDPVIEAKIPQSTIPIRSSAASTLAPARGVELPPVPSVANGGQVAIGKRDIQDAPSISTLDSESASVFSSGTQSYGARNRIARKQRRDRNYVYLIAFLAVLFVGLLTALIVVLWIQSNSKQPVGWVRGSSVSWVSLCI